MSGLKNRILLVDNDEDYRRLLFATALEGRYEVTQADSGLTGLEALERGNIDLILSDVHMPGMDGIGFLKEVRRRHPEWPYLVLMSGFNHISAEEAYDLGAAAVLAKPFPKESLWSTLDYLLASRNRKWAVRPPRYANESDITVNPAGVSSRIEGKVMNIGRGGAFVQSKGSLPENGSQIQFAIQFQASEAFELTGWGIVRWVRKTSGPEGAAGFGIEFLFLDEPGRTQLTEVLNKLGRIQYIPIS